MINYILVSILIYIVLILIIVLLGFLLFRKRQSKVVDHNKKTEQLVVDINKIESLNKVRKEKIDEEFKKAKNFDDIKSIFVNL